MKRSGGTAGLATHRADSAPDQVTGKSVRQDVERYAFWQHGTQVVLTTMRAVRSRYRDRTAPVRPHIPLRPGHSPMVSHAT
ncbi:hypothetical protein [Streptomyces sp. NBC_01618]|uniref:hypothetical protein n=1 Tax=Streptomyces sp. NBC_01618 TaxID=2975900 RepID=UPI00386615A8|nr:hypothetical protein OH735_20790 [Streptomyces sp. NBC_01618]